MSLFVLLLGGICLGLMTSMNGQLASYFNVFEISFLVHAIGAVILLGYILFKKGEKLRIGGAPGYVYFVGFFGVALVATGSISAAKIGATLTMALSVSGQLLISAVIDHFGFFHVPRVLFNWKRIPAFLIIAAGLLIMIYA
ncbi:MAG: DMT family transporter [bacterium]|jgi:Uncharacterized protein conserved in bacteria